MIEKIEKIEELKRAAKEIVVALDTEDEHLAAMDILAAVDACDCAMRILSKSRARE
jgi:hypothetical protein